MNLAEFLTKLDEQADTIEFTDTMAVIEENYSFTPVAFTNGDILNEADQNNGSCKIFAFGLIKGLTQQKTLACFGSYYRDDVLNNPDGDDHQNIRNFINTSWPGIQFHGRPLTAN